MPVVINKSGGSSRDSKSRGASGGARPASSTVKARSSAAQDPKRLAAVVALVAIAVLIAGYSAYRTLINPPEAGEQYRAQAAAAQGERPRLAAEGGQSALPSPDEEDDEAMRNQGGASARPLAAPGSMGQTGQGTQPGIMGGGAAQGGFGGRAPLGPGTSLNPDDN